MIDDRHGSLRVERMPIQTSTAKICVGFQMMVRAPVGRTLRRWITGSVYRDRSSSYSDNCSSRASRAFMLYLLDLLRKSSTDAADSGMPHALAGQRYRTSGDKGKLSERNRQQQA